jgi:hypothetical protein
MEHLESDVKDPTLLLEPRKERAVKEYLQNGDEILVE